MLCSLAKHLHFVLVWPKGVLPKVLQFVQMQLCKPKLCCSACFQEKILSLGQLLKIDTLHQYFSENLFYRRDCYCF